MWIAFAFLSFLLTNFVHCGPLFKRDQGSSTRCLNVYPECPEWKQNGMCEQNREYMAATCPVTCGFCGEGDANEVDDGEQSGDERDSSGNVERDDISSGTLSQEAQPAEEDKYKQLDKSDKEHDERNRQKNVEEERTENAEKYEDEESENENKGKQVQERRNGKKDLMTSMMANGKLRAIAVTKGKARNKVPDEESKPVSGESDENSSTDIDLDLKEAGLDAFSGSGQYDDKLHLTLRQTYNKNFDDKNSPAYKILSGNFQKDMDAALGDENEISNIDFSEVEVEGNPKTSGKVRVNFKFAGNYEKLSKIVKSGNINGLLVMKNSLEGPMLDVKDSK